MHPGEARDEEAGVGKKQAAPPRAKYDPTKTRRDILSVATREFAKHGFNGARIDAIAARTSTTKRMIYYYFGGKERLYIAVLEQEYAGIRTHEARLQLELLPPELAIRRLTEFTFDYDHTHPDFVRLVAIENIHHARHLAKSAVIREVNQTIVDTIEVILRRGGDVEGVFHPQQDQRHRSAHADERALLFPRVEPAHLRRHFPSRFQRRRRAQDAQENGRRIHRSSLEDRLVIRGSKASASARPRSHRGTPRVGNATRCTLDMADHA